VCKQQGNLEEMKIWIQKGLEISENDVESKKDFTKLYAEWRKLSLEEKKTSKSVYENMFKGKDQPLANSINTE